MTNEFALLVGHLACKTYPSLILGSKASDSLTESSSTVEVMSEQCLKVFMKHSLAPGVC